MKTTGWFDTARFGMFMHWGHSSQQGIELSWPLVGGVAVNEAMDVPVEQYHPWQTFCAGMAQLQMIAVVMNLMPLPPLDGFQMLAAYMDEATRAKFMTPPVPMMGMIVYFAIFWSTRAPIDAIYRLTDHLQTAMRFDWEGIEMMRKGFNLALFGHTD